MINLALSILFSVIINLIFRYFSRFGINNRQAITFNYLTCMAIGFFMDRKVLGSIELNNVTWFPLALCLGVLFIGTFFLMARTAQELGVSVSATAAKMSLIFPVITGWLLYEESLSIWMILGIALSFPSVILTAQKSTGVKNEFKAASLWMPVLVFMGSGGIDTALKWIETQLNGVPASFPGLVIFSVAALIGLGISGWKIIFGTETLEKRNVLGGMILGVPNYFSVYFLLKALNTPNIDSVYLFPVNNIGTVLLAALAGLVIFRERFSLRNTIGLGLAIISIILMQF